MSRVLEAKCDADGKVFFDGNEVPGAQVMSEGKQASEGILIISQGTVKYFPSSSSDIKTTLDKISSALSELVAALTTIDAKPVGGTGSAPAPGAAGQIANLNTLITEVNDLGGALK